MVKAFRRSAAASRYQVRLKITITFLLISNSVDHYNSTMGFYCSGKYNLISIEKNHEKKKIGKLSGKDEFSFTYIFSEDDFEDANTIE